MNNIQTSSVYVDSITDGQVPISDGKKRSIILLTVIAKESDIWLQNQCKIVKTGRNLQMNKTNFNLKLFIYSTVHCGLFTVYVLCTFVKRDLETVY